MPADSLSIAIPEQLFAPAESLHFQGEYCADSLQVGPDDFKLLAPAAWECDITNTGDALLVAGTASATVETSCARCLDAVTYNLEGQIEGYFLLSDQEEAPEDMAQDEFDVLPASHVLDMEPLVCAALILEMPAVPLCAPDCAGLCSRCGANLNDGPCSCEPAEEEPARRNPFAVLAGYKFEDED